MVKSISNLYQFSILLFITNLGKGVIFIKNYKVFEINIFFKKAMPGVGLNQQFELFVAGGIYGFQIGAVQAFSRSLLQVSTSKKYVFKQWNLNYYFFKHMTPLGAESEFFAFFELTDKGTSWLGPLVLAFMTEGLFLFWVSYQ